MKTHPVRALLALSALLAIPFLAQAQIAADLIPPVVVKTFPQAGADDVPPGDLEIRITFSKPMKDQCFTINPVNRKIVPEFVSRPVIEPDGITFVARIKVRPNTTYGLWVNGPQRGKFQDTQGIYALPYQFVFKTKAR